MSDSDDDIMGLLPAGGAGASRRPTGTGALPPRRLQGFKAMLSDDSSDDDKKKKKSTDAKAAPAAKGQPKKTSRHNSDDETGGSIQFEEGDEKTDDVSLDLSEGGSPKQANKAEKPNGFPPKDVVAPKKTLGDIGFGASAPQALTVTSKLSDVAAALPAASPPRTDSTTTKYVAGASSSGAVSKLREKFEEPKKPEVSPPKKAAPAAPPAASSTLAAAAAAGVNKKDASATTPPPPAATAPPAAADDAVEPQRIPRSADDDDADNDDVLDEILPLHPNTARGGTSYRPSPSQQQQQPTSRSPSVNSMHTTVAGMVPRSPVTHQRGGTLMNQHAPPQQQQQPQHADPLEELLFRAQQRLKEKDRVDLAMSSTNINEATLNSSTTYRSGGQMMSSNAVRAPSPHRAGLPPSGDSRSYNNSTSNLLNSSFNNINNAQPLLPVTVPLAPDNSKDGRLQRENARLTEELAFLTCANQKLRGVDGQTFPGSSEIPKLQLQIEVLRQQLRENELESQRSKTYTESQLDDARQHIKDLADELKSYSATASQYEVLCRDKDQQLQVENQSSAKLRAELGERIQEVARIRDDHARQREDDSIKLERTSVLLDDAKRQRVQLTELNDKFCRDKEGAVADRRKMQEDLRLLQAEVTREKDKQADETSNLRREIDRLRTAGAEKERLLMTQLRDESKAKEHFHFKLLEVEESLTLQTTEYNTLTRSMQDAHRKETDDLQRGLLALSDRCRASERSSDELKEELEQKLQRERALLNKEASEKSQLMKDQRDDALEKLRRLELEVDGLVKERDHYRAELERAGDIASQWQRAKDKAETQSTKLSASLSMLIAQDEQLVSDNERLRVDLEQAHSDVHSMRGDMESLYHIEQQLQDLSVENDRLSDECGRLARERNELITENGKLAEEMLKWRSEVRELITAKKAPSSQQVVSTSRAGSGVRLTKASDFGNY